MVNQLLLSLPVIILVK